MVADHGDGELLTAAGEEAVIGDKLADVGFTHDEFMFKILFHQGVIGEDLFMIGTVALVG